MTQAGCFVDWPSIMIARFNTSTLLISDLFQHYDYEWQARLRQSPALRARVVVSSLQPRAALAAPERPVWLHHQLRPGAAAPAAHAQGVPQRHQREAALLQRRRRLVDGNEPGKHDTAWRRCKQGALIGERTRAGQDFANLFAPSGVLESPAGGQVYTGPSQVQAWSDSFKALYPSFGAYPHDIYIRCAARGRCVPRRRRPRA